MKEDRRRGLRAQETNKKYGVRTIRERGRKRRFRREGRTRRFEARERGRVRKGRKSG